MINDVEIISDLKSLISKIEYMTVIYRNNELWKEINEDLNNILSKIIKDKKLYGY